MFSLKKKTIKVPFPQDKSEREGWLGLIKDGYNQVVDNITMSYFTNPKHMDKLGMWMRENSVTYLKIGAIEIKRSNEDKK